MKYVSGGLAMKVEWKQCYRIGISIFILFICMSYWTKVAGFLGLVLSAMSPLIIGFVIAYLLNILMNFFERFYFKKYRNKAIVAKSKRPVCLILSIVTMIGIVGVLVYMIIPELISCFALLIEEIPGVVKTFTENEYVKKYMSSDVMAELNNLDWQSYAEKFAEFLSSGVGGAVDKVASMATSVFSSVASGVLGFIFAIYFLLGKEQLIGQSKRIMLGYLKEKWYNKIMYFLSIADDCFHQYIVGKCIDAVILGVMCAIGMAIFRFPYAVMIGALVGFTALIPVAGAYIGAGVGAFMILTVSPFKALLFIIFIIVLQQIEGNLIYPKVMSSSIGLPGVWVLAAITVGGSLSGVVGMLIGVPIAAVIYRIVKEDVVKREKEKKPVVVAKENQLETDEDRPEK